MTEQEKLEKVIKVLEGYKNCVFGDKDNKCTVSDILELLNAQKPVAPERERSGSGTTWWNLCGVCKTTIFPNDKYCHECGRAVKWE